jgi:hypothetical protein
MPWVWTRSTEYYDMPAVLAIVQQAARDDCRFSTWVTAIVQNQPIQFDFETSEARSGNEHLELGQLGLRAATKQFVTVLVVITV